MFVYIVGNIEQNIFRLGVASDPLVALQQMQQGNPYQLSVISKIRVRNKNEATLVEQLGYKQLSCHTDAGEWLVNVPTDVSALFSQDHWLRSLASRAGVKLLERNEPTTARRSPADLQRLLPIVKKRELTFEEVLCKVEQAYNTETSIDEVL
ncbi:MAG: hypothetical protein ACFB16_01710 [Phormidesmis sp.]